MLVSFFLSAFFFCLLCLHGWVTRRNRKQNAHFTSPQAAVDIIIKLLLISGPEVRQCCLSIDSLIGRLPFEKAEHEEDLQIKRLLLLQCCIVIHGHGIYANYGNDENRDGSVESGWWRCDETASWREKGRWSNWVRFMEVGWLVRLNWSLCWDAKTLASPFIDLDVSPNSHF